MNPTARQSDRHMASGSTDPGRAEAAVEIAPGVHWVGAMDPTLRSFDMILRTANGTTYNAYAVRGSDGVAVIDTVKAEFSDDFFRRLESIADYAEIRVIVLNHLEPDHTGALPELMRRAPQARLIISKRAPAMLKALLKPGEEALDYETVTTGDEISLGDRRLRFLHTPFLHWPDTQCTYLVEAQILFSGDVFGCHYCDDRLFNDRVGDFRFSFDYYYAHIMRPFKPHVLDGIEAHRTAAAEAGRADPRPDPARSPAPLRGPLPGAVDHQPMLRARRSRSLADRLLHERLRQHRTDGRGGLRRRRVRRRRARVAVRPRGRRDRALRRPDRRGGRPRLRLPHRQRRRRQADLGSALVAGGGRPARQDRRGLRFLRLERRGGADGRGPPARPEVARAGLWPARQADPDRRRTDREPRIRPTSCGGHGRHPLDDRGHRRALSAPTEPAQGKPVIDFSELG